VIFELLQQFDDSLTMCSMMTTHAQCCFLLENRNAVFFFTIAMLLSSSQSQCCFLLHHHLHAFYFFAIAMGFFFTISVPTTLYVNECHELHLQLPLLLLHLLHLAATEEPPQASLNHHFYGRFGGPEEEGG
jgi:hypothetical protein